jgi:hypothetical protein
MCVFETGDEEEGIKVESWKVMTWRLGSERGWLLGRKLKWWYMHGRDRWTG